jgi:hypothetical protein
VPPKKVEYCRVPVSVLSSDTKATPCDTFAGGGIAPAVCGKLVDAVDPVM